MRLGIHVSIQGGLENMARAAASLQCEAVQIFSRSPRGGKAKDFDIADLLGMRAQLAERDIHPLVVHVPYFLNLASSDDSKRSYSIEVLVQDLQRTEALGGKYLVTHIGHKDKAEPVESVDALGRVLDSVQKALAQYTGAVMLLLENTAGQGQEIGYRFETIGALLRELPEERVGACFDTCHAFAAGYDLRSEEDVSRALSEFDEFVGVHRLHVVHLNDSKGELGSHIDRHEHIGYGKIGLEGLGAVIRASMLDEEMAGILETPRESEEDDRRNVETVKKLRDRSHELRF